MLSLHRLACLFKQELTDLKEVAMSQKVLTPQAAQALLAKGAILVDIRGADEYAREHIAEAHNRPMDVLNSQGLLTHDATAVIFHCNSGNRTLMNSKVLPKMVNCLSFNMSNTSTNGLVLAVMDLHGINENRVNNAPT